MAKFKGYRLQPQVLLRLELYSRLDFVTYNSCVETAIIQWAKQKETEHGVDWREFSHPEPGYAECAMYLREDLAFNEKETAVRRFVKHHIPFFYDAENKPDIKKLRVLWPDLDQYRAKWEKSKDTWAVGEQMAEELRKANIKPPQWGPHTKEAASNASERKRAG